jgi:hypothetical protein
VKKHIHWPKLSFVGIWEAREQAFMVLWRSPVHLEYNTFQSMKSASAVVHSRCVVEPTLPRVPVDVSEKESFLSSQNALACGSFSQEQQLCVVVRISKQANADEPED